MGDFELKNLHGYLYKLKKMTTMGNTNLSDSELLSYTDEIDYWIDKTYVYLRFEDANLFDVFKKEVIYYKNRYENCISNNTKDTIFYNDSSEMLFQRVKVLNSILTFFKNNKMGC